MQDKIIFREMLSELKALADSKGGRITTEEAEAFLVNAHLDGEQLKLIYEYLLGEKIQVVGYESESGRRKVLHPTEEPTEKQREEEQDKEQESALADRIMQLYASELGQVTGATEEEELALFCRAVEGDTLARGRLTELYLNMVYELSMTWPAEETDRNDLIQEGNVALLLAVNSLQRKEGLMEYRTYLFSQVQEAMEEVMEGIQDRRDLDREIEGRANHLQEAVRNLEEDLSHKVSIEELSAYLEMPLEEIRDILRMTGEEIDIQGKEEKGKPKR